MFSQIGISEFVIVIDLFLRLPAGGGGCCYVVLKTYVLKKRDNVQKQNSPRLSPNRVSVYCVQYSGCN